jgi:hypothetical protein
MMRTSWLGSLIVLAAACGGVESNPDAPPPAADAPPATPDAESTTGDGIVIIAEQTTGGGAQSIVGVTLNDGPLFGAAPTASVGGCDFYMPTPDTNSGLSAGVITVTGTTAPVTATPDSATPPVSYDDGTTPDDLFAPGAQLTVSAAGEPLGLPAFTGTVVAPDPLANVTFPASISRTAPTIITYTAGTSDEVWAWILGIGSAEGDLIFCRTTDTGSFTFPTAAIAMLPGTVTQGLIVLWRTNASSVIAGPVAVALTAADAQSSGTIAVDP